MFNPFRAGAVVVAAAVGFTHGYSDSALSELVQLWCLGGKRVKKICCCEAGKFH